MQRPFGQGLRFGRWINAQPIAQGVDKGFVLCQCLRPFPLGGERSEQSAMGGLVDGVDRQLACRSRGHIGKSTLGLVLSSQFVEDFVEGDVVAFALQQKPLVK